MKADEDNPYFHLMPDWNLVALPEFRTVFKDVRVLFKYMNAAGKGDVAKLIDILCDEVSQFEELCDALTPEEVIELVQDWIKYSRPIGTDKDEK